MGLFDFLKAKNKSGTQVQQTKNARPECDIEKTGIMVDLFQIPQDQRDEQWQQTFYENVQTASYACGNPQIFNGPDGFPYFILQTPEADKPFESFCIRNMKDDFLLEKGLGVVINPKENLADWVFSYGDILNLHLNKKLFSKTDNVNLKNAETLEKDEKILLAQPSENYLPKHTRELLKKFLQNKGQKRPKIMMVCRKIDGEIVQELAFNLFHEDFSTTDQLNHTLKQISWFLPRHYVVLSFSKNTNLAKNFVDL